MEQKFQSLAGRETEVGRKASRVSVCFDLSIIETQRRFFFFLDGECVCGLAVCVLAHKANFASLFFVLWSRSCLYLIWSQAESKGRGALLVPYWRDLPIASVRKAKEGDFMHKKKKK